ncbi:sigma-70 family RNA polymerase sigma factor [Vibrio sp. 99-70-13A1]|uniref:sigma-70 family RNA polymerase sigma factor n=1 Tax=Vibrio sp. 99-70-13A1 TaxID=2607601 RepID=UPI0014939A61|nr:sigma-70 family RNA polymerase sigma factor [Vibrio sp. 99-70-13A1]NOH97418.1 sigma-70 family RNA polymerase sigma factor [Vibrio sp. 99-70-13A1]
MKCLMKAWEETEPMLYGWLMKQTKSQPETEDIMQEVFLKAMQNSEKFCSLDDGKSWIFKVTKNYFIDRIRRKVDSEDIDEYPALETVPPVMIQLQTCLPRLLPKLDSKARHIIEACDLNGLTQLEYSELHDLSLAATKARLRRARLELKDKLISECKVKQDETGVCCFKRIQVNEL